MSDMNIDGEYLMLDKVLEEIQHPVLCVWGENDQVWLNSCVRLRGKYQPSLSEIVSQASTLIYFYYHNRWQTDSQVEEKPLNSTYMYEFSVTIQINHLTTHNSKEMKLKISTAIFLLQVEIQGNSGGRGTMLTMSAPPPLASSQHCSFHIVSDSTCIW